MEKDHELITFRLKPIDKIFLIYSIIGVIILYFFLLFMTKFEGVWIAGMPKSLFGMFVIGIIDITIGITAYFAYKNHFAKLEKKKGEKR